MANTKQDPKPSLLPSTDAAAVREYVMGGRSTFTVVSTKTQARYTFRVRVPVVRRRNKAAGETIEQYRARKAAALAGPRTVEAMTGSDNYADYTQIGTITEEGSFTEKSWTPRKVEGRKTGFAWFWMAVNEAQEKLVQAEVWHDGHCSCCGKKLTVPESLSTGIGPVCATFRLAQYNPQGLNTHLGK